MNPKNTWTLVALAAGLFAFIYFVERHAGGGPAAEARQRLLPTLEPALVTRIELRRGTNHVSVERTGDQWRLVSPVAYPALAPRIRDFLATCARATWTTAISAQELAAAPRGLVDYGLQPPAATLAFTQDGQSIRLNLGAETPVEGQRYAQLGDEIQAFVVDAALLAALPAGPNDWRDIHLLPQPLPAFNRIEVRSNGRVLDLQRDDPAQPWRIVKPIAARADNTRINDLVQQWRQWPVMEFIADEPLPGLESFGLKPPELELLLGQGTNDVFSLQFGAVQPTNPAQVFARRSSHSNIVAVPKIWLDPLRGAFMEFRERRLLTFPPAAVETVQVRGDEAFTVQRAADGGWRVLEQTNLVVDSALVGELVTNLHSLEIVDFVWDGVTDLGPYGLAAPAQRYALLAATTNGAATNLPLAVLELGGTQGGRQFARRPDENSVYGLGELDVQALPRAAYQLRDRRVWRFATNEVAGLLLEQDGRSRELVRNPKGVWALGTNSQGIINPLAVEETVFRLGELRTLRWVARGPDQLERHGITPQSHAITVLLQRNGGPPEKLMLRLGRPTPGRGAYAAVVLEGRPVVLELNASLHDHLVTYLSVPPPRDPR